jgi:hypothetical protein
LHSLKNFYEYDHQGNIAFQIVRIISADEIFVSDDLLKFDSRTSSLDNHRAASGGMMVSKLSNYTLLTLVAFDPLGHFVAGKVVSPIYFQLWKIAIFRQSVSQRPSDS